MQNKKIKTVGIILLVIMALAFVINTTYEIIAKSTLEKLATAALGTEVSIGSLDIAPLAGSATLTNLEIKNPKGYGDDALLTLPYLYTSLNLKTVFSPEVRIHEIRSEDMIIHYKIKENGSNLNALQTSIKKSTPQPQKTEVKESSSPSSDSKSVIIESLKINGGHLKASIGTQEALSLDLANIEMKNVGEQSELTTQEIIALVVSTITQSAVKASSKISLKAGFDKVLEGAGDIGSSIKGLFE